MVDGLLLAAMTALWAPALARGARSKVPVVGLLGPPASGYERTDREAPPRIIGEALRDRGWIDGANIRLDWRSAGSDETRIAAIIDSFLRVPVDVLVVFSSGPATIALERTSTVPIVAMAGGLVEGGLAASLSRPARNLTGISHEGGDAMLGKMVQLLKEAAPAIRVVAILSREAPEASFLADLQRSVALLQVKVLHARYADAGDVEAAILYAARRGADALLVWPTPVTNLPAVQRAIHALCVRARMPAMHAFHSAVATGGLMAYTADAVAVLRRMAGFIDRILRGADPGTLPIEQPDNHRLHLNLKAAKQLGLEITPSLILQADRVVQ